jgi:AraC-like DNA-binding protein
MKAKSPYELIKKVWRPQHIENLEIMHGTTASYSTPRHFHDELELLVVQGNSWTFYYRGAKHAVPPGILTLNQPGEVHTAHFADETGYTFRALRVHPVLLQNTAIEVAGREKGLPFFSTPLVTDKHLKRLVLDSCVALEAGSASVLEQESRVLNTLAQLLLRYAADRPTPRPLGWERQPVKRVRDYLEDNYAENVSLEQLASIACLSPFHLNRVFCKEIGLPPHAYQTQVRVNRAKTLLTSGWSIGQVALEIGFASQSHFGCHFKRLVGITPRQYVRQSKNLID